MLSISKPMSVNNLAKIIDYYGIGLWQGKLAKEWGLSGYTDPQTLSRLLKGITPDGKHQVSSSQNPGGMRRRCAFDLTFNAPKSVSLLAFDPFLNPLINQAHQEAVLKALELLEEFTQTRMTTRRKDINTRKWITALFQHNDTRPVQGIRSPQLHTHCLLINITQTQNGEVCAIDPREIYESTAYGTAIYRLVLCEKLQQLGFRIEIETKTHCPQIIGISPQYRDDASLRKREIDHRIEDLRQENPHLQDSGKLRSLITHQIRSSKQNPNDTQQTRAEDFFLRLEERHGHQVGILSDSIKQYLLHPNGPIHPVAEEIAREAATYSCDVNTQVEAVFDKRSFFVEAARYGYGKTTLEQINTAFSEKINDHKLVKVAAPRKNDPSNWFSTNTMLKLERQNLDYMHKHQNICPPLITQKTIERTILNHPKLNLNQKEVLRTLAANSDKIQGLNGVAGSGKSFVVDCLREAAENQGFQVLGFAPTTKAAQVLQSSGLQATTLQSFIARKQTFQASKRLLILDESSLAETRNIQDFFQKLQPDDRVVFLGDTKQLEAVGAGTPFAQLYENGMRCALLTEIVRQKRETAPELRKEVNLLFMNKVEEALENAIQRGQVHEVSQSSQADPEQRCKEEEEKLFSQASHLYLEYPDETIVIAPSNRYRRNINARIHKNLLKQHKVVRTQSFVTLNHRFDLSGEERTLASNYQVGDILRFSRESKVFGISGGEYATVEAVDTSANKLTIRFEKSKQQLTYDPRRLKGVTAYYQDNKSFGINELIQFTSPIQRLKIANRELGKIQEITEKHVTIKLLRDSGESLVHLTHQEARHLDYGYSVTAMSAQGQTQQKALFVVDAFENKLLLNQRSFYVAWSRATGEAIILTNNLAKLKESIPRKQDKLQAQKQLIMRIKG